MERLEPRWLLAVANPVVDSAGDGLDYDVDDGACAVSWHWEGPPESQVQVPDESTCTLRAARDNADASPGHDTITFAIPAGSVIATNGISFFNPVTIDAPAGKIVLSGPNDFVGLALREDADGSVVRNLVVNNFGDGIIIGSDNALVVGCHIGVNLAGTAAAPNRVGIRVGGTNNTIGGTTEADRNIISGNTNLGILLQGQTASDNNQIIGNYIGTDVTGTVATGNGLAQPGNAGQGIRISLGGGNVIGGPGAAGNVISGNRIGVLIDGGSSGNYIVGNKIGTTADGSASLGNIEAIEIFRPNNVIGGDLPGGPVEVLGNVISASLGDASAGIWGAGVHVIGPAATGNKIQGNKIGMDPTGIYAMPNQGDGVSLNGASNNFVGGTTAAARNIISANNGDGVFIGTNLASGANNNVVEGNYIGVDATGAAASSNGARGVHIDSNAANNTIGGDSPASRNVISGNNLDGVIIALAGATNNVVKGNYIGTDATGMADIGNGHNGVRILRASNNVIGQSSGTSFVRNLISGNARDGVRIDGDEATGNVVAGNWIGTDATGAGRVQNDLSGVYILNAAGNIIGGAFSEPPNHPNFLGNTIAGNSGDGVKIEGATATGNLVGANLIGTTSTGLDPRANIGHGIHILNAADNRIGASKPGETALTGNTIAANLNGIKISGETATGNLFGGNRVGTDFQGRLDDFLHNSVHGVWIVDGADNFVGGFVSDGAGGGVQLPENTIANNGAAGVIIQGDTATGNRVQRNSIFANHGLGIDLGGDGVTANDELDADGSPDSLPNRLQNFPQLFALHQNGTLLGELRSTPNTTFTIDLYHNEQEDVSGHGEGQAWIEDQVVETDQNGVVFFDFSLAPEFLRGKQVLTATATDPEGNTSEFSGPLRMPDLTVTLGQFSALEIERRGARFILPYEAMVANVGTSEATDAVVHLKGDGQLVAVHTVTLEPAERQSLNGEWDVTDLFPKGELGAPTTLNLVIEADPLDAIAEMPVAPNTASVQITVDPRPRIVEITSEFKPEAYYLNGVSLPNKFDLTVDWNGDLDDSQVAADIQPTVNVFAGGTVVDSRPVANPFGIATVSIDLGKDLSPSGSPGLKLVQFRADTDLHFLYSEYSTLQFNVFDSVDWINVDGVTNPFWTVAETPAGAQYDKIAIYKAGVFFPQLAAGTQGEFGLPVDRIGLAGGAFGPKIPQFALRAEIRSDKTGSLEGEGKLEAEVAGKDVGASDFGSIGGSAALRARGTFKIEGSDLKLDKLTATLRLDGNVTTPKVPFPPPASFIKAQGKLSLGVDATFDVVEATNAETNKKELGWKEDVILGLEPALEAIFSVGQSGVATVEVGVGGRLRGEFELDGEPCVEKSAAASVFARLKATFLAFAAQKTFQFPFVATACQAGAAGEGENLLGPPRVFTDFELLPRFVPRGPTSEGESASAGLPAALYPYAKPALARAADGAMTLVFLSEDPDKPDGQHLELFASSWDGNAWAAPVQLTDDTLLDDAPTVAYDAAGNAVAMWTRLKNPVADAANADPHTLRGDLEIVYAIRLAATGTWSAPAPLTDNAAMDFLPRLQADASGSVMAVWLRDSGNDSPIFPDDPAPLSADFVFAQWDGAAWSAPAVAVGGVATNEVPQFALGNGGLLVWSEDGDGNATTDRDRTVQAATWNGTAWSAPSLLAATADGLADVQPRVVYDSQNRANVTWVKAGVPLSAEENHVADQLFFTRFEGGAFSPPALAIQTDAISDPRLILDGGGQPLVVWQGYSQTGPDIFYSVREGGSGDWSPPAQFTDSPELEWWFNPFVNDDGQLEVLHLEREVDTEPAPDGGSGGQGNGEAEAGDPIMVPTLTTSRLATAARTLGYDLAVTNVTLSTPQPSPGSVVQVTATVRNVGDYPTPASTLTLRDDGTPIGAAQAVPLLAAGQSVQVMFDWLVPLTAAAPHALTAEADPNQLLAETNEANNAASLIALQPDLVVEFVDTSLAGDTITVTVGITNHGGSPTFGPFAVQLRQDDPASGTLLGTQIISDALPAGGGTMVTFVVNNAQAELGGAHAGFVVADAGSAIAEADEANNVGYGALDPRPLLMLALPAAGGPFRVWRDGGDVVVTRQDATELLREPLAALRRLTLATPGDDLQVIVDRAGGDPAPAEGLVVIGAGGNDHLTLAGAGSRTANLFFHGGAARNTLSLLSGNASLDLTDPAQRQLANLHAIDVRAAANALSLNKAAVDEVTDATKELRVLANLDDTVSPGPGWTLTGTQVADGGFFRVLQQAGTRLLLSGPADWQNPLDRFDVDADGTGEPQDVLLVINELNGPRYHDPIGLLTAAALPTFPDLYFDVSGDGFAQPLDVLLVINFLNRRSGAAEGEGAAAGEAQRAPIRDVFWAAWPSEVPAALAPLSSRGMPQSRVLPSAPRTATTGQAPFARQDARRVASPAPASASSAGKVACQIDARLLDTLLADFDAEGDC